MNAFWGTLVTKMQPVQTMMVDSLVRVKRGTKVMDELVEQKMSVQGGSDN